MLLFNASNCTVVHETLGQRLNRMIEDVRVHNPNMSVQKLAFKTVGRVTVLFRTESEIGVSIMEYTDCEDQQVLDLAVYSHKTARQVYEELRATDAICGATTRLTFHKEWDLVYKLIELLH